MNYWKIHRGQTLLEVDLSDLGATQGRIYIQGKTIHWYESIRGGVVATLGHFIWRCSTRRVGAASRVCSRQK